MVKMRMKWLIPLSSALLIAGCGGQEQGDADDQDEKNALASAQMKNADSKEAGTVTFHEEDGMVQIHADLEGLTPGHHGFHVHEKGVCEPDAAEGPFMTAGGHYNPDSKDHGSHAGDLPSIYVNENGEAEMTAVIDGIAADQVKQGNLSVMVHSKPDNFANIPDRYQAEGKPGPDAETLKAGDAGDRQACGVITAGK